MKNILFSAILYILVVSCNIAPGSYPYAEIYEIEASESAVIAAVNKVKDQNPAFCVPAVSIVSGETNTYTTLSDGRRDNSDYWYHVYFYYQKENEIIYMWTRPFNNQRTHIGLVSINEGLELGNWKDINHDFSYFENKTQKQRFVDRVLSKILANLE